MSTESASYKTHVEQQEVFLPLVPGTAPYEGYGEKVEGMQYAVDDSKPATLRDRNVARRMELGDSS